MSTSSRRTSPRTTNGQLPDDDRARSMQTAADAQVERAIQEGMDRLAKRRSFPIFG